MFFSRRISTHMYKGCRPTSRAIWPKTSNLRSPIVIGRSYATPSGPRSILSPSRLLFTGAGATIGGVAYYRHEDPTAKKAEVDEEVEEQPITHDKALAKLRSEGETVLYHSRSGIYRQDSMQLPSNSTIEDSHAELLTPAPGKDDFEWSFFGIYDGHIGPHASRILQKTLLGQVADDLKTIYACKASPSSETINHVIQASFLRVDTMLVLDPVEKLVSGKLSKTEAAHLLNTALTGACALVAFYEPSTQLFRVAVTGDSRAVLGRRRAEGTGWTAIPLSVDQTGGNESEAERVRALHPGEADVVQSGRILGLEPSRTFGDSQWKWTQETIDVVKAKYYYQGYKHHDGKIITPPYVTAQPVVSTTKIEPQNGDFVVLACDGLWELLTNEEVIGLVGMWIDEQKPGAKNNTEWIATLQDSGAEENGQKKPDAVESPAEESERFVLGEQNAAVHLVRNALGGKDEDKLCSLLTLKAPISRNYRDDLTVKVLFFGGGQ